MNLRCLRCAVALAGCERGSPVPEPAPSSSAGLALFTAVAAPKPDRTLGGDSASGPKGSFQPQGDFWRFDLETQPWEQITTGRPPSERWHAAMAIDEPRRQACLFGGAGQGSTALDARPSRWLRGSASAATIRRLRSGRAGRLPAQTSASCRAGRGRCAGARPPRMGRRSGAGTPLARWNWASGTGSCGWLVTGWRLRSWRSARNRGEASDPPTCASFARWC
jgi:hypothetical protein